MTSWIFTKNGDGYCVGYFRDNGMFRAIIETSTIFEAIDLVHYLNGGDLTGDAIKNMFDRNHDKK